MVALHLDNSTAKAYSCNHGATVLLFLYRLACSILNLADKHGIALILACIPVHLNVGADYILQGRLVPEQHLPSIAGMAFQIWSQPWVDLLAYSHTCQCQHYYKLGHLLPLGAMGLSIFNYLWTYQVSYIFPLPVLVPLVLSKFFAEQVRGQFRLVLLVVPCWIKVPWLPRVHKMLEDIPL